MMTLPSRQILAWISAACLLGGKGGEQSALGNPPAPFNLVYGVVRDMYGTPLTSGSASIVLETPGGKVISTPILPGYAPGVNYRLKIPMDCGDTLDLYHPNALLAGALFKLYAVVNNATNLPIEMTVNYATLGQPGQAARVDLTLGVDSNGDGIPDQWEQALLAALGLNLPLSSLNGNSVLTADGLTLRQQYLFGAYPFDSSHPCLATFLGFRGTSPDLQFPTVTGRYYSVLTSTDAINWSTAAFFMPGDDPNGTARTQYYATGTATTEVYVQPTATPVAACFYRILVQ